MRVMWSSSGNRRLAYRCMDDPALGFLTPWNTNMVRPSRRMRIAFNFAAEATCLEEMLACAIPEGALFYQQTRHRERVSFDESLRNRIVTMTGEMHDLFARGHTPKVRPSKACRACSLRDVCLPKLVRTRSARQFIEEAVRGEVEIGEKSDHI